PADVRVDSEVAERSGLERLLEADASEEPLRRLDEVVPPVVGVSQLGVRQCASARATSDELRARLRECRKVGAAQVDVEVAEKIQRQADGVRPTAVQRSEEHTSELQSRFD